MTAAERKIRVLVVDDDDDLRSAALGALEPAGFVVQDAKDGDTGLGLVARFRPDLVLLDVDTDGCDGFTVCRRLRAGETTRNLPVVMMTEHRDTAAILTAYEVGATDFVVKPPNWLILGHRLRYLFRSAGTNERLRRSETKLATAQQIAGLGSWEWSHEAGSFEASDGFCHLLGLDRRHSPLSYREYLGLIHEEDRKNVDEALQRMVTRGGSCDVDFRIVDSRGSRRIVHQQAQMFTGEGEATAHVLGTVQDVTKRKQYEDQIHFLAHYDALTGLANRRLLAECLDCALEAARREDRQVAVLFIDVDSFKRINDTLGHTAGDVLLQHVADRLRECSRGARAGHDQRVKDVVARIGGDEFIVLLPLIQRAEDAARVATRLIEAIARPMRLDTQEVVVTASVGIAIFPVDGEHDEELLRNADAALYHAKEQGRNTYRFYTRELNRRAYERLVLENSLRKAVEQSDWLLHYQPQYALATGRVVGAEALVRWHHPELGLISPAEFITLAEETGMIVPIGEWVLREACRQCRAWHDAGYQGLRVAVNVSARQFSDVRFVDCVSGILADVGLDPGCLELELTESIIMEEAAGRVDSMLRLHELGVRLSIDDFGTGYSSLNYLTRFPIDTLKIDQGFLLGIPEDSERTAIVQAILALARTLRREVVAEGVETTAQLDLLRREGCDKAQGYLWSPPVTAERFMELMRAGAGGHAPAAVEVAEESPSSPGRV